MARVPYVTQEELSEEDRPLLARPINLFRALANSPGALRHFDGLGQWIRFECELDPRLRELAILQVGYLTRSSYEWSHHAEISQRFGVVPGDIHAIAVATEGRNSGLAEVDRLVLRATRELTNELVVTDETWTQLEGHFDPGRLVDLVVVVAFYSQVVRVLSALQIDVEPDWQPYLDEFPLPAGDA
jgi:alkylhydroperoxidase family enzyme